MKYLNIILDELLTYNSNIVRSSNTNRPSSLARRLLAREQMYAAEVLLYK